jgi:hypothetical protein
LWQLWQHAWMSPALGSQPTTRSWDSRILSCGVFCFFLGAVEKPGIGGMHSHPSHMMWNTQEDM